MRVGYSKHIGYIEYNWQVLTTSMCVSYNQNTSVIKNKYNTRSSWHEHCTSITLMN